MIPRKDPLNPARHDRISHIIPARGLVSQKLKEGSTDADSLKGVPISTDPPSAQQVLTYADGMWKPQQSGGGGSGDDHGILTGLSDDDHPQYVLLASTNYIDLTDGGATVLHSHTGGAHNAITLGADVDAIVSVDGSQVLSLDTQAANLIFAGPSSGGAVDPTFRALVSADLPASAVETSDANYIDLTDGGATTLHSHAAGGAPADARYLTLGLNGTLTNEISISEADESPIDSGVDVHFKWSDAAATRNFIIENIGAAGDVALSMQSNLGTGTAIQYIVTGDAQPKTRLTYNALSWGPGGGSVADTNIYRQGIDVLATDDNFRMASAGKTIQDSGGNARITLATSGIQVTMTGDSRVASGGLNINTISTALGSDVASLLINPVYTSIGTTSGAYLNPSFTEGAAGDLNALAGIMDVRPASAVGTNPSVRGLNFQVRALITTGTIADGGAAGLTTQQGVFTQLRYVAISISAGTRNLNITNSDHYYAEFPDGSLISGAGTTNFNITDYSVLRSNGGTLSNAEIIITNFTGLYLGAPLGTSIANRRGIVEVGTGAAGNTHGNFIRSNTQFGSTTGAFGTGDGVIGLANAATIPSTNPAAGIVAYAEAGDFHIRADNGSINQIGDTNQFPVNTQFASNTESFGSGVGVIGIANANTVAFTLPSNGVVVFASGGDFRIFSDGGVTSQIGDTNQFPANTQFGGNTENFGGGTGVIGIRNATVVPSTNPGSGGVLYCEAGALKYRSSGGVVTTLAGV